MNDIDITEYYYKGRKIDNLTYTKLLRLEPANCPMIGEDIMIYDIKFQSKIYTPNVFVFETDEILTDHYFDEISFIYKSIKYQLIKSTIRRNDDILVIECEDFKMTY